MALTKEQQQAIIEAVYDRAARGEPPLTTRLAAESRRRRELKAEVAMEPIQPTAVQDVLSKLGIKPSLSK